MHFSHAFLDVFAYKLFITSEGGEKFERKTDIWRSRVICLLLSGHVINIKYWHLCFLLLTEKNILV